MNLYALFVKSGHEERMLKEIASFWLFDKSLHPFVPIRELHFRKRGETISEKEKCMPGYVFIKSALYGLDFYNACRPFITRSEVAIKLLRYGEENFDYSFEMAKEEAEFMQKLFGESGYVEVSKAEIIDEKLIVTDGPLVGLEAFIEKVNRHKRLASVKVEMYGTVKDVEFGIEIVSKLPRLAKRRT